MDISTGKNQQLPKHQSHLSFTVLCVSVQCSMCIREVDVAAKGNVLIPSLPRRLHLIHIANSVFCPSLEQQHLRH